MDSLLFLCVGAGLIVAYGVRESFKLRKVLNKQPSRIRYLPRAISMLVLTAQVSELVRVVEQVSVVKIIAALFLLAIVAAGTSGTEGGLH
jgi:hypothetical protein